VYNLYDILDSPRFQPWEKKIEIINKELKIKNKEVKFVPIFYRLISTAKIYLLLL
jgi:hypothetical protein